ncbi:WD40 repeat domain-containing serine/threonine protein kinase [Nocardia sp. NPDC058058]|uniref:WD40 repeat domain-containing serine/threonine protein kinase n=1 Tax=Nocardia sp. NPDC058058 TaxID=3346317 RepID=UPI0036DA270C
MRLQTGAVFAGYTIERQLGAGGMGVVYLARHPRLERSVALKVLNDTFAEDYRARARFEREAALITTLDHPNIVPIYDRNSPGDPMLWISMKYVDGGDAAAMLAREGGRVSAEWAVRMISDAGRALDHAHRHRILHRDIKPANLLVERGIGGIERTVVTDFGIARSVEDAETNSRVSATLAYAAPERFAGGPTDHRADQYSLGCTLFKLLTGEPPYPRADDAAVVAAHLHAPPPRATQYRPDLPSGLDDVLATVLAKRPEHRFPDCAAFAAAARDAVDRSGSTVAGHYFSTDPGRAAPGPGGRPGATGPAVVWHGEDAETAFSPPHPSVPYGGGRVDEPVPHGRREPAPLPAGMSPGAGRPRRFTRRWVLIGGAVVAAGTAATAAGVSLSGGSKDSATSPQPTRTPSGPAEFTLPTQVMTIAFSPDGTLLAVGGKDNTTRLIDVHTGVENGNSLTGHSNSIRAVAFSPDGKLVATGGDDRTARLWDAHTRQPIGGPLTAHTNAVRGIAFHPDGSLMATCSDDNTALLWTVQTRQPTGTAMAAHTGPVRAIAFHPKGTLIATGSQDTTARLWRGGTGIASGAALSGHHGAVRTLAFHPEGKLLATGGDDASIRLWDTDTRTSAGDPLSGHAEPVLAIAFSPDGTLMASSSRDGTVRLWDNKSRQPIGNPLSGHADAVHSVAFSPDGTLLATGSADNTVRLWKVADYH